MKNKPVSSTLPWPVSSFYPVCIPALTSFNVKVIVKPFLPLLAFRSWCFISATETLTKTIHKRSGIQVIKLKNLFSLFKVKPTPTEVYKP